MQVLLGLDMYYGMTDGIELYACKSQSLAVPIYATRDPCPKDLPARKWAPLVMTTSALQYSSWSIARSAFRESDSV